MKITIKHYFKDFQVLCIEAFYDVEIQPIVADKLLREFTKIQVFDDSKTECEEYFLDVLAPELLSILSSENPRNNNRFGLCITATIALMESDIVMGRDFVGDKAKRQIKELLAQLEALNLDVDLSTGYFRHTREIYACAKRW